MPGAIREVRIAPFELSEPFVELAARFAHEPGTVALISGGDLDCARYHILGLRPWLTLSTDAHSAHLTLNGQPHVVNLAPFACLQQILQTLHLPEGSYPEPLAAGLLGYLSYDLKDALEILPRTSVDDLNLPHMLLYAHRLVVVHDKHTGRSYLSMPMGDAIQDGPETVLQWFYDTVRASMAEPESYTVPAGGLKANFSKAAYESAVQQVIDYIAAGDIYQVNLSQRFQTPFQGDGFALFRHLYTQNPAPFFAFINAGDHQVLSTSPERFLLQRGRQVETRPIKGTRPRGDTPAHDSTLRAQLAASVKDDAELSMIVDLLRNDIGKVCQAGTVRVAEHKRLEAYQNVYHLVSVVDGRMDAQQDSVDLLRATFPGGSITGCPKVRAMEIIDELEPCRRHVYCGSIGYISFHDTMDLSIAIRTATITNNTLYFSVGGGVVYDSSPDSEYEETLHKGKTIMAACQSDIMQIDPAPVVWCNGRLLSAQEAAVPVNDLGLLYGYGFFETIRVDNGDAPLLTDHLQRFTQTWKALMPGAPPDITWASVIDQVVAANALQNTVAAVKILATRGSRSAAAWDHTLLVSARPYTHRLVGKLLPGLRLGSHPAPRQTPLADFKTLNYLYYLQAGQWAQTNEYDEALILNPDGTVSETNTANLLIINDHHVVRPASSAVLSGVMAGALCRQLSTWGYTISHDPVSPEQLISAQQVLAANALMGAVPVLQIDGQQCQTGDDLWRRLNDAVIPGWREEG